MLHGKALISPVSMSKKLSHLQSVAELLERVATLKKAEDARMSKSFLKNIIEHAEALVEMIDVEEDLDDWVDAKITKANEALSDVYNFIRNYDKHAQLKLNTTPKLFKPEKAEQVAKNLKKDDPEWDYKVVHDPKGKGYSFIEIYDEDGGFVGHWSDS